MFRVAAKVSRACPRGQRHSDPCRGTADVCTGTDVAFARIGYGPFRARSTAHGELQGGDGERAVQVLARHWSGHDRCNVRLGVPLLQEARRRLPGAI